MFIVDAIDETLLLAYAIGYEHKHEQEALSIVYKECKEREDLIDRFKEFTQKVHLN